MNLIKLLVICFAFFINNSEEKNSSDQQQINLQIQPSDGFNLNKYDNKICNLQLSYLISSFPTQSWAAKVFDSWGKLPSGLMNGNIVSFGDFDECVNINKISTMPDTSFKGQYCLVSLNMSTISQSFDISSQLFEHKLPAHHLINLENNNSSKILVDETGNITPMLGLCVSNTCDPKYLKTLLDTTIGIPLINIKEDFCQEKTEIAFSSLEIFAICFFSFFALMMVVSTAYDVIQTKRKEPKRSYFIAFSMYTNGAKIFKCTANKSSTDVIDCLHGIRTLSIVWVVFGHSYMMHAIVPNINLLQLVDWIYNFHSTLLLGATVSVDSFFLLSGLLVGWSMFKELDKKHGRLNILLIYFHRYIRLTPVLAAAILFMVTLSNYVGSGPMKPLQQKFQGDCENYWWTTLLYIQNYVNKDGICLGQTWYLAVDTQLFVLSPLVVYPIWKWKNKAIWIIPLLTVLSMACTFMIYLQNGYSAIFLDPNGADKNAKTYVVTHTRFGPYLIGILLGYILHNLKGKSIVIPKIIVICCWIISLGSILAIIFSLHELYQPTHVAGKLEGPFFEPFSRVGWAISLAWIIFACVHGYGGPVNWFLSWPQWQPISRLSYVVYIVHMPIQLMLAFSVRTNSYFSDANAIHGFWGDFGLTLTVAIFWSMAFESPILALENILLRRPKSTEQSRRDVNTSAESADTNGHQA